MICFEALGTASVCDNLFAIEALAGARADEAPSGKESERDHFGALLALWKQAYPTWKQPSTRLKVI